ncbi:MAG: alpha/beta hydrolase fold domain-containing protein [Bacteroidetes bacterium]|nr:alpha/beta hydrolase fold domain-containing protein [Bacteroidota bacterium]
MTNAKAQSKIIPLYNGASPGTENLTYSEKITADSNLVYNVSHPTLTVYSPDPNIANGTAVIVCPGGGFYIHAIKVEGTEVADYLIKKGITVFLLKYRLGQSMTDKPGEELGAAMQKKDFEEKIKPLIPFAIADGHAAIQYVRAHAAEYKIAPNRIGIIGFSAGGTVTACSAFNYSADNRPDFVAPIYAYVPAYLRGNIAMDAPPIFLVAASDDPLGLATHSVEVYNSWLNTKHSAELHLYTNGGHGFGMRKQNIPTDAWIDRFAEWLGFLGMMKPIDPKVAAHIESQEKLNQYMADLLKKDWANIGFYEKENSQIPPPAPGEKRVVFMGNSITQVWRGWNGNPLLEMIKGLGDSAFFVGRPYYDRGIGGQTTGQMLVRFREDVINLKPAVVVIMAGINDIAENNGPSKLEDVFGNIVSMAELAKLNHIQVVLSSVMPAYNFPWRPSIDPKPSIKSLNEMIRNYCDKNDIVYLDYFTAMADERKGLPQSLSLDGVHPNLAGYKIMEPLAEKAIDKAFKKAIR